MNWDVKIDQISQLKHKLVMNSQTVSGKIYAPEFIKDPPTCLKLKDLFQDSGKLLKQIGINFND